MCNILYVCTKIQLFLSHTQRGFVGHLTWPFCSVSLLSVLHEAYKVKVNSSAAEGDFMTYKASVVEVLKNTDTGERSQNADWQLTHLLWHIREWVFHLLSRPKFCSFFKKNSVVAFAAVKALTEVELLKKATCNAVTIQNNNQYLVMGASGTEIIVDNRYKSVSLLLLLLFLLILFFCWLAVLLGSRRYRLPLDSEALVEPWPTDCTTPECQDYVGQLEDYALELQLGSCPE